MKKPTGVVTQIAQEISYFFLDLANQDYTIANKKIADLFITDIVYSPGNEGRKGQVTISLARPGLIIGRNGSIINALTEQLTKKFNIDKVDIEESFSWTLEMALYDPTNYFE